VAALESVHDGLSDADLRLLTTQADSSDRTLTATGVAEIYGSPHYQVGNLRYGNLGSRMNDALGGDLAPARSNGRRHFWTILAHGEKHKGRDFEWTMHGELAEAVRIVFGGHGSSRPDDEIEHGVARPSSLVRKGKFGRGKGNALPANVKAPVKPKISQLGGHEIASVPKKMATKPHAPKSKTAKQQKQIERAKALGVTVDELRSADLNASAASQGLADLGKAERRELVARRLGISKTELTLVRDALAGKVEPDDRLRVTGLVQLVSERSGWAEVDAAERSRVKKAKPKAATKSKKAKKAQLPKTVGSKRGPSGETPVYVTKWGNVVHMYSDCHSTRGFRNQLEADPFIYQVLVKDPCCRGRKTCGTCSRHDSMRGRKIEQVLRRLHGEAFDEGRWAASGWNRPLPTGRVINPNAKR